MLDEASEGRRDQVIRIGRIQEDEVELLAPQAPQTGGQLGLNDVSDAIDAT